MKIDKAIFGADKSYFLEFWPLQSKICKELLGIEPVLFYICDEDSDFYYDDHGLVKKIKKVGSVNTGLLACIVRMFGSKYFPDEVCLTCDLDMLMINKNYFIDQIEEYKDDSLVIYSSDAYDLNRPESIELFKNENFPFVQEMYNYPYNAAKGKIFNKILNLDCSFDEFVNRHSTYKPEYKFMWMIDEFYFSDCVNNKNHGVEVHKLKRGYTSPWKADRRIDRHNFPVELEHQNEIEAQMRDGVYQIELLQKGYYIDVNCCRPYSKYKQVIDDLIDIVLDRKKIKEIDLVHRTDLCDIMDKHKSDKASKPDWVDYGGHNYTRFYSQIFGEFRNKCIDLFELGIGTNNTSFSCNMGENGTPGASLRGWKEYFQNSNIYGADIDKNILFEEEKIKTFFCDQTKEQEIKLMWDNIGKNMDIIIDDGYHNYDANLIFLKNSLMKLKPNGYYIVEDIVEMELPLWEKQIPKLEREFIDYKFDLINLKWTHSDNNLLVIKNNKKEEYKSNNIRDLKKVALISTFCDTEEKKNILKENIIKMKSLGVDVMAISPRWITLPDEIIKSCDYFFYTRENPLLVWPQRMYTHWYQMPIDEEKITVLQRGLPDYGWAALYQTKKLSQIALSFDYDLFYHMIYDLEIDEVIEREIKNDSINLVHPRRNPNHPEEIWETTLHFMSFDRSMMEKIEKEITLENYQSTNGVAEGEVLKWKNKFNLRVSDHPVKDKIFYWENYDFFDYSPFPEFKMFLSKNEPMTIWLGENPCYESNLTSNLRIVFHGFEEMDEIKITVNGFLFSFVPKRWEIIEIPVGSLSIEEIIFEYNSNQVDFSEEYKKIMLNQIYYNHRP